jgi:hypothetical protein
VLEKVSKTLLVWYNFNSRQMTLSISNFNNLKSAAEVGFELPVVAFFQPFS